MQVSSAANSVTSSQRNDALEHSAITAVAGATEGCARDRVPRSVLSQELVTRYPELNPRLPFAVVPAQEVKQDGGVNALALRSEEASKPVRSHDHLLVHKFLAKLALGESTLESRLVSLSNRRVHRPQTLRSYLESLSAQFTLFTHRIKGYNQVWLEEILDLIKQLEPLRQSEPETFAQLVTNRLKKGSLSYRLRVCEGLNKLLEGCPEEAFTESMKPLADIALADSGSHVSRYQCVWGMFVNWCCDRGFMGVLGRSYLIGRLYRKEELSRGTLAESWGAMIAALTLASQCDPVVQRKFGIILAEKVLKSTKSLEDLHFCRQAWNEWSAKNKLGQLTRWSLREPVDQLIEQRVSDFVNSKEFDAEVDAWVKEAPAGQKRREAARRIREWLKDRDKCLDVRGLNLKTLPKSIASLAQPESLKTDKMEYLASIKLLQNSNGKLVDLCCVLLHAKADGPYFNGAGSAAK